MFNTTIHELAHAAHLVNIGHIQFWQYKKYIYESWAITVEKVITEIEYLELCKNDYEKTMKLLYKEPEYLGGSGPCPRPYATGDLPFYVPDNYYNYQRWPFTDDGITLLNKKLIVYTPMFIDLIDDQNQRMYYMYKAEKKGSMTPAEIDAFCGQFPDDEIAHFTLKEVQDIVFNKSYGFSDLKRNVKNSATGKILGNDAIDIFFERYEYYIYKYGK